MSDGSGKDGDTRTDWSADELIPFGKYVLLDRLSSGATAAVYRANVRGEAGFERLVAIKRILPHMAGDRDFVDTFVREAKTVARLTHAAICPIYELGKVGESLYMAIEYVQGKDLGTIMQRLSERGQTVPPVTAAWTAARLCEALDYAHNLKNAKGERKGIIHRDLSPSNVLISYEGQVKLIDFGLAKAVGRAQSTNVDALKRKLSYMSPEMVKGRPLDGRSDLFGVGVCLYEMLTGRKLFQGQNDIDTLKLVGKASVPPPSAFSDETPEELELVVMHALQREPTDRFRDAAEMCDAISAYLRKADATFGLQQLSQWMHGLFGHEILEERGRVTQLLAASADPAVLRERRHFFASPSGAAARARAELQRKITGEHAAARAAPLLPKPAPVPQEARAALHGGSAAAFEDEPTAFYDGEKTVAAPVSYDPHESVARTEPPPNRREGLAFEDEPTGYYDGEKTTTARQGLAQRVPEGAFADEPTQYLTDRDVVEDLAVDTGGFDEEATTIFFNKEDGVGLQEMLDEINDVEPAAPLNRPIVAPELGLHASVQHTSGRPASGQPLSRPVQHPQQGSSIPPYSMTPPVRLPPPARAPVSARPMHAYGLEPQPRARAKGRGGLWVALGVVFLLLTIAGIVFATPVGIALGVRKAPLGAVELRTQPNAPARIKLDDVYRGVAPLRMEGVRVGPRRLSIEADGYLPVAKEVEVQPGATALVEVSLVPDRPHGETAVPAAPVAPSDSAAPGAPSLPSGVTSPPPSGEAAPAPGSQEQSSRSRRSRRQRGDEPESAATTPAPSAPAVAPNAPGNLVINSVPWAYVWVDGMDTRRTTPMMGYPLPPGVHEVQLRTAMGQVHTERVTIQPGQTARITRRF
jgi:eukaryotic-like serine/threonine-protein kinase